MRLEHVLGALLILAVAVSAQKYDLRKDYENTLQAVSTRFCSQFDGPEGESKVLCSTLQGLEEKWIDADARGDTAEYMKMIGAVAGHYCATERERVSPRCEILKLLMTSAPTTLRWTPDREQYLQLTHDVAEHYCNLHREDALFCGLAKGLKGQYYESVTYEEPKKYKDYLDNLAHHYCVGEHVEEIHARDDRCLLFPLLQRGIPDPL